MGSRRWAAPTSSTAPRRPCARARSRSSNTDCEGLEDFTALTLSTPEWRTPEPGWSLAGLAQLYPTRAKIANRAKGAGRCTVEGTEDAARRASCSVVFGAHRDR